MTLHPIPSEFPIYKEKIVLLFYQCTVTRSGIGAAINENGHGNEGGNDSARRNKDTNSRTHEHEYEQNCRTGAVTQSPFTSRSEQTCLNAFYCAKKRFLNCTANEGQARIQYKCMFPIYVFPEMKLLFPKQNYNVLSPSSYTHISVRDLYISKIGLPILLQGNMWTDPGNICINGSQTHECGN
jgi:hypothetical protein